MTGSEGRARPSWRAVWLGRCPSCRTGRIFAGVLRMNEACPACGLRFSREEGYFTGSMYISYTLAVAGILAIAGLLRLTVAGAWTLTMVLGVATILFAPLVPAAFRYARILWIHLDRTLEP